MGGVKRRESGQPRARLAPCAISMFPGHAIDTSPVADPGRPLRELSVTGASHLLVVDHAGVHGFGLFSSYPEGALWAVDVGLDARDVNTERVDGSLEWAA